MFPKPKLALHTDIADAPAAKERDDAANNQPVSLKPFIIMAAITAGIAGFIFLASLLLPAAPVASAIIGAGLLKLSAGAAASGAIASTAGGVGASILTGVAGAFAAAMTAFGIFAVAKKSPEIAMQETRYSIMK